MVLLFAVSWLLRYNEPVHVPSTLAFILAVVAALLALVTGWLRGELVERLGIGVDPGANPNAPSSLSGRPASAGGPARRGAELGERPPVRTDEQGSAAPLRSRRESVTW